MERSPSSLQECSSAAVAGVAGVACGARAAAHAARYGAVSAGVARAIALALAVYHSEESPVIAASLRREDRLLYRVQRLFYHLGGKARSTF